MKINYYLLFALLLILSQGVNAQWEYVGITTNRSVQSFAFEDSTVVVGTNQGMNYSSDYGNNWTFGGGGISYEDIRAVIYAPIVTPYYQVNWIAGTNGPYVYASLIPSANWSAFPNDSAALTGGNNVNSILKTAEIVDRLYVGTDKGMYLWEDLGYLWYRINNGLYSGDYTIVRKVIEYNGEVFIGTNSGVYKRTSTGWIEKNVGLTNTNVTALCGSGSYLFAGTSTSSTEGVFISSDQGESWSFSKTIPWVTSIQAVGPNIFASSYGDGIWRSTNYGNTWQQINDGFTGSAYYILSTGINDKYIYAGTNASGVWRRELTQVVSDVNNNTNSTPSEFSLEQNYPNPFNPSTSIQYRVSSISNVSLKVYDLLGNEVTTLVNEEKPAGIYKVDFDASQLSSGIYFYTLKAGIFNHTRKMILVK